jgi:hypothetical protein
MNKKLLGNLSYFYTVGNKLDLNVHHLKYIWESDYTLTEQSVKIAILFDFKRVCMYLPVTAQFFALLFYLACFSALKAMILVIDSNLNKIFV